MELKVSGPAQALVRFTEKNVGNYNAKAVYKLRELGHEIYN